MAAEGGTQHAFRDPWLQLEGDMGARELGLISTQVPVEGMGCPSEVICGERTHKGLG